MLMAAAFTGKAVRFASAKGCEGDVYAPTSAILPADPCLLVEAEFRRGSPRKLEHGRDLPSAHNRVERFGNRIFGDPVDAAVRADEDHVERDQRVLHPEARDARPREGKDHASVGGKAGSEHQPARLLLAGARDLDVEF